jgi:hypothetical protein
VRQLGLGNGAFYDYMIYFSIIVPSLSLGFKVSIGAFGDCKELWICGGGGGLVSLLTWGLLFYVG